MTPRSNIYQPHIYITGKKLKESAFAEGTRGLASIKITWGTDDWYSEYDAAAATIKVRNRFPNYAREVATANARILITRDPDDTVVFRGRVVQGTSTMVEIQSPDKQISQVFEHELKAEDVLGDLRRDRRRGPIYASREGEDQVAHWGPCTMAERKADISSRCPVPIEWLSTQIDEFDEPSTGWRYIWPVTPYERQSTVSLLTVLRNTARISNAFRRPIYLHSSDQIVLMTPSHGGIGFTASPVTIPNTSAPGAELTEGYRLAQLLPADEITRTDISMSTTEVEQVTRLELQLKACRYNQLVTSNQMESGSRQVLEWVDANEVIDILPKAGTQLTVSFECDHSGGYTYPENFWHQSLAASEMITGMHGKPSFAPIKYKFPKDKPAPEWALQFLVPEPPHTELLRQPKTFMAVRSIMNAWPKQPGFSILGGTITYTHQRGWVVELEPVPAPSLESDSGALTLNDLQNTQIADAWLVLVVDDTTVADWQQITDIA